MEPALARVAGKRWRIALVLTGVMVAAYFSFILLVAYDKAALGAPLVPGLSVGMALGVGVILVAWIVTSVYVHWANTSYDAELSRVKRELEPAETAPGPIPGPLAEADPAPTAAPTEVTP